MIDESFLVLCARPGFTKKNARGAGGAAARKQEGTRFFLKKEAKTFIQ
jgi:hypothetical protein